MKDSEKSAELWSAAPAEQRPRSPAGTVSPASLAVRPSPGAALTQAQSRRAPVLTRMLRRTAELPAGGGCSDDGGSFRFASTPVAAPRPGTASSGRSASFAAAARLSQGHGVAQGPGGPGSPGGKDLPLPDTSGFLGEGRAGGWRAERRPGSVWSAPPPSQVCPRRGELALCAGDQGGPPAWAGAGTNFSRSRVPGEGGGLPSPIPSPTQPQAPRGQRSYFSRAVSPTPGAAGLAPKPGAAAPWESRDACWDGPGSGCAKGGDLVAPLAAPRGPRGPDTPHPNSPRCVQGMHTRPCSSWKFGNRARTGLSAGGDALSGGAVWPGSAPGGSVAASPEHSGCLSVQRCH